MSVSPSSTSSSGRSGKIAQPSVCHQFKQQLDRLMAIVEASEPHFVRCIKSNDAKQAGVFDSARVLQQLRYAGILEVAKIRQMGFPVRKSHAEFARRFGMLLKGDDDDDDTIHYLGPDLAEMCKRGLRRA